MKTIKTDIIPKSVTFVEVDAPKELDLKAICIFAATGFFLDQDTYYKEQKVLKPATHYEIDADSKAILSETPYFNWHYTPKERPFAQVLEEFSELFEQAKTIAKRAIVLTICFIIFIIMKENILAIFFVGCS